MEPQEGEPTALCTKVEGTFRMAARDVLDYIQFHAIKEPVLPAPAFRYRRSAYGSSEATFATSWLCRQCIPEGRDFVVRSTAILLSAVVKRGGRLNVDTVCPSIQDCHNSAG